MSEADGTKRVRGKKRSSPAGEDTPPGARPIRTKGYYRALKRGEPWAVKIDALFKVNTFAGSLALYFRNINWDVLDKICLPLEKTEHWSGGWLLVPFFKK